MEEQISFLDGGFSVPEEAQQTFFPQLQLPQQVIDEALCMGFNDQDSRKIICAYFMKDKPDNAACPTDHVVLFQCAGRFSASHPQK